MKKRIFPLFIPLLILTSCGSSYDAAEQRATFDDALANLTSHTFTKYSVVGTGHVVEYDVNPLYAELTDQDVPEEPFGGTTSLFIHMPMILNTEFADTIYSEFTSTMTGLLDVQAKMYVEKTEDNLLHIYSEKNNRKNFAFYNVDSDYDPIYVAARFAVHLYYNQYGLLVRESIKTVNSVTNAKEKTVDLEANYTYTA